MEIIKKIKNLKAYSIDFFLSILATFLSTGVMQLIVFPILSRSLSTNEYGEMLTATGFVNIAISAFGNNLFYSRLRQNTKYENKHIVGDYQLLLCITSLIALVGLTVSNLFLKIKDASVFIPLLLITLTGIWKSYYLVTYRLTIDYKKNLIANIYASIGYCIGGFILINYLKWPWIFFLADILTLIFIFFSSDIICEPIKKTMLFPESASTTLVLLIGGLIGNVTTYLDRFIIYPFLGSASVSIYATAAWFSKSMLIVIAPITGVLLSYITTGKLKLNKKKYKLVCLILIGSVAIFWGICLIFAPIITSWMYPTIIELAKPYIAFASLAMALGILGNFLAIMVLAYAPVRWQTIIPIVKILVYLIFGIICVKIYNIVGMIIAVFCANLLCNIIQFFVAGKWVREEFE